MRPTQIRDFMMKKIISIALTAFFVTVLSAQVPKGTYVAINEIAKGLHYAKFEFTNGNNVKGHIGVNGQSLGVVYDFIYSLNGNTLSLSEAGKNGSVQFTYDKTKDQILLSTGMAGYEAVWGKEGTAYNPSTQENPVTPTPAPKKGQLIFLTHGLEDNGTCFEQTVESLKLDKNGNYHDYGLVSASYIKENENKSQYINQLINGGKNVLVRLEFSAGNLSFNEQFSQMDKMVKQFEGHFANVVFIGHSMGGLASIRYGMYYAKNNPSKKVKIITVDTPYQPNNYAKMVWNKENLISGTISFIGQKLSDQKRGYAHRDLGGYKDDVGNFALLDLRNNWNQYKKYYSGETAELYAISVSMYSKSEPRWSEIGDGIVDIPAQQGDFREKLDSVGKWDKVNKQETIFGTGISTIGIDIATAVSSGKYFLLLFSDAGGINDRKNPYFHQKTPALPKVIEKIKKIIEEK